ncbi:MAG TPA: BON domain-containing protein [Spirochaetota bacterium]
MKKKSVFFACAIFGLIIFSGCTSLTGETAGENIDDSTIHATADGMIVADPDAHYLKIDVTVTRGEVVLTGFVNSRKTEERIVEKITTIKGVKSVKSLLRLNE